MLPSPTFTSTRSSAINEFNSLCSRASINFWLAKIVNRNNSVRSFIGTNAANHHGKHLTGVQSIPVENIVGTIQRTDDFDKNFRPLKMHLRDRWVNALLQLKVNGWQPIVVHKVGEFYYVEDGHHRVSVANSAGILFIEAAVWDHTPDSCPQSPEGRASDERLARQQKEIVCSIHA